MPRLYRVEFKESAVKEIRAIGRKKDRQRVLARIDGLASNPRPPGSAKLSGSEAYRIRLGEYRVLYTIEDAMLTVQVVKVGNRREVYR